MLPNWESGPQNQPKAKVAVLVPSGTAASMGGIIPLDILSAVIIPFSFYALEVLFSPTSEA